jgi:hypothetical protein
VVRQILGHQRAAMAVVMKAVRHTGGMRRIPVLAFLAWRLVKPGVRLVRRAARRDPLPASLLMKIWLECIRGLGAYSAASATAVERKARTADTSSGATGAERTPVTYQGT